MFLEHSGLSDHLLNEIHHSFVIMIKLVDTCSNIVAIIQSMFTCSVHLQNSEYIQRERRVLYPQLKSYGLSGDRKIYSIIAEWREAVVFIRYSVDFVDLIKIYGRGFPGFSKDTARRTPGGRFPGAYTALVSAGKKAASDRADVDLNDGFWTRYRSKNVE